jgi:hypothetical protein
LHPIRTAETARPEGEGTPTGEAPRPERRRRIVFQIAAVLLTAVSALAGTGLARWLRAPAIDEQPIAATTRFPNRLFLGWNKPDLVLILSAQQKGYLLPCGCSRPQVGGLERRYNFLKKIQDAGWPYVGVDLGDIPQRHGPAGLPNQQGLIKYLYSMNALRLMNYTAVGFGEYEVNLGLSSLLDEYALENPKPRVVIGNLIDAEKYYPTMTEPWKLAEAKPSDIKVGVTAVISPREATRIKELTRGDKKVRFEKTADALKAVLARMKGKADLPVLLYQGPSTHAKACAEAYPQFPIVLCLSEEDEPPSQPVKVKAGNGSESWVISVGKKGKFIGVVGVWKTGKAENPYRFAYERAEMTEDFLTPKDQEKGHPIVELMENYTKELRDKNFLEKYGQVRHALQVLPAVANLKNPGNPEYVGSETCKKCHEDAYKVWKGSPHSHAYQTLVEKATRPGNRQYDPECIVCHTVGFGYQSGFVSEKRTPKLKDVGCEACHGPASLHVANKYNLEWRKRINPWKYLPKEKRKEALDQSCQKCHDIDNDVTWIHGAFEKKWPKVQHYKPKDE